MKLLSVSENESTNSVGIDKPMHTSACAVPCTLPCRQATCDTSTVNGTIIGGSNEMLTIRTYCCAAPAYTRPAGELLVTFQLKSSYGGTLRQSAPLTDFITCRGNAPSAFCTGYFTSRTLDLYVFFSRYFAGVAAGFCGHNRGARMEPKGLLWGTR